eukprot:gene8267-biopygen9147
MVRARGIYGLGGAGVARAWPVPPGSTTSPRATAPTRRAHPAPCGGGGGGCAAASVSSAKDLDGFALEEGQFGGARTTARDGLGGEGRQDCRIRANHAAAPRQAQSHGGLGFPMFPLYTVRILRFVTAMFPHFLAGVAS